MKPKTFYILMLISGISLFSSAKQAGKCDKHSCSEINMQKCQEKISPPITAKKNSYDLSPLSLCLFNL